MPFTAHFHLKTALSYNGYSLPYLQVSHCPVGREKGIGAVGCHSLGIAFNSLFISPLFEKYIPLYILKHSMERNKKKIKWIQIFNTPRASIRIRRQVKHTAQPGRRGLERASSGYCTFSPVQTTLLIIALNIIHFIKAQLIHINSFTRSCTQAFHNSNNFCEEHSKALQSTPSPFSYTQHLNVE